MAKVVALANVIMPTKNTEPMEPDTVRKEVSSDEASGTLRGVIWLEPRTVSYTHLSEQGAFRWIQKTSMDQRIPKKRLAMAIIAKYGDQKSEAEDER